MPNQSKDKNYPYISVVINCYNRKKFLKSAIYSVLNQDLDKDKYEIIVLKKFKWKFEKKLKSKVKFIFYKEKSACKRLQRGVIESKGKVIAFLEDDDLFEEGKLSYIYNLFKNDENLGYYHNDYNTIDEKNEIINPVSDEINKMDFIYADKNFKYKYFLKMIKFERGHNNSCQVIRKNILKDYLNISSPFPDIRIFYAAYVSEFSMFADSRRFTRYRLWSQNLSRTAGDINKGIYIKKMVIMAYKNIELIVPQTKNNKSALKFVRYNILWNKLLLDMLEQADRPKLIKDLIPHLLYTGPVDHNFKNVILSFVVILYIIYPNQIVLRYMR